MSKQCSQGDCFLPVKHVELAQCRIRSRRGFTIIELLLVVGIVGMLAGLLILSGSKAINSSKKGKTKNTIRVLDEMLQDFMDANNGAVPPYLPKAYERVPGADGPTGKNKPSTVGPFDSNATDMTRHPRRPDVSVFFRQIQGYGKTDAMLQSIESLLVVTLGEVEGVAPVANTPEDDTTPSVFDAWGSPKWDIASDGSLWTLDKQQLIYYVHPENEQAQRLYGRCQNGRPYFFSAGPDKKYGISEQHSHLPSAAQKQAAISALADNIYSTPGVAGTHDANPGWNLNNR